MIGKLSNFAIQISPITNNTASVMNNNSLTSMTREQFVTENWNKGDIVTLTNGKDYDVIYFNKRKAYLILYSKEYDAKFRADYRIIHSHKPRHKK